MIIYPAIDLYAGKVVRLTKGQFDQETVYSVDPISIARQWEDQGAAWLHIVDLEGAKTGILKNLDFVLGIRKAVKCRIQFGGGLRTTEDIKRLLEHGIDRVVIGTKALDENFLQIVMPRFGEQIAIGLDARNGIVQTQGWQNTSGKTIPQTLELLKKFAIGTFIYTDIQRDGMLHGPNFIELEKILAATESRIILSGGVSSLNDVERCSQIKKKNFDGVIVGKALYNKKFLLPDAVQLIRGTQ